MRADGPACPACGSADAVVLDAAPEHDESFADAGWLLLTQALAGAYATGGAPGMLLGSLWGLQGACAVLLIAGLEQAPRTTRVVAAASFLVHLLYTVKTGQTLFGLLSLAVLACALVRLHTDRTRPLVRAALPLGWIYAALLCAGGLAPWLGWIPPGWWRGEHPLPRPAEAPPSVPEGHGKGFRP